MDIYRRGHPWWCIASRHSRAARSWIRLIFGKAYRAAFNFRNSTEIGWAAQSDAVIIFDVLQSRTRVGIIWCTVTVIARRLGRVNSGPRMRFSAALLAALICLPAHVSRSDAQLAIVESMTVLWSDSAPFKNDPPNSISVTSAQSGNELAYLLSKRDGKQPVLMIDPAPSGPGQLIAPAISGWDLQLAGANGDGFWIGGVRNPGRLFTGAAVAEAYLVKIGRQGRVIWQRVYGGGHDRSIESIAAVPLSDDVVVAGKYNDKTWIARIASDGRIIWERFVGLGKGSAVAISGDKVILATFETGGGWEDVGFWTFDNAGQLLDYQPIRRGVNHDPRFHAGKLIIESSGDATFIFSAWGGLDSPKPWEVVKINRLGQPAWRKEFSETILNFGRGAFNCSIAITILSNGDPLIACPRSGGTQLIRVHAQTGNSLESWVSIPAPPKHCDGKWAGLESIRQKADGTIWAFGVASHCMWLGQIPLKPWPGEQ
jgi:hypothetical protein